MQHDTHIEAGTPFDDDEKKHTLGLDVGRTPKSRWAWTTQFEPSWFLVCMGTGAVVQVLTNFPYPTSWLVNLGRCFWALNVVLFLTFTILGTLRVVLCPRSIIPIFTDFSEASTLGAYPVALDAILTGILSFYSDHSDAAWLSFVLFCIAVALTLATLSVSAYALHRRRYGLKPITGGWLLSLIPLIVTAATGSKLTLLPYADSHLPLSIVSAVLVTSFLLLALGLTLCLLFLPLYLHRLLRHGLPPCAASAFVPAGPFGMGAYAVRELSLGAAQYVHASGFTILASSSLASSAKASAVASECIYWIGTIAAVALLAPGAFFIVHGIVASCANPPQRFVMGCWACVFPVGVWANGAAAVGVDIGNEGLKGVGATAGALTVGLWGACAVATACWMGHGCAGWLRRRS